MAAVYRRHYGHYYLLPTTYYLLPTYKCCCHTHAERDIHLHRYAAPSLLFDLRSLIVSGWAAPACCPVSACLTIMCVCVAGLGRDITLLYGV